MFAVKRYILIGPSAVRKAYAEKLKDEHEFTIIDAGSLLKLEVAKAQDGSDKIKRAVESKNLGKFSSGN